MVVTSGLRKSLARWNPAGKVSQSWAFITSKAWAAWEFISSMQRSTSCKLKCKSIAEVAGALGNSGINIRDIEVLHVREGEGGTLLVSLSTQADHDKALGVLEAAGFVARHR